MDAAPALRLGLLTCSRYCHTPGIWGPIIQPEGRTSASRLGTRVTRMRLTHVWDVDGAAAQQVAREYGARAVAHFADMVGQVDGVILDDFDSSVHFPQLARPYLEAGVPMFINRPFALSMPAAEELVARARAHQTPIMSASTFEFAPEVEAVRAAVQRLDAIHGYAAANSMSDYATHGIHGLWFAYACMGGGVRSVAYQTGDWHAPNGVVTVEHEGRHGGPAFYGAVQQIGGAWGWIRVFGASGFEQSIGSGPYFWLPLVVEMQRMFETRQMPQSYDVLLEKTAMFLAGFRSHLDAGGAPVRLDQLGDWQAPLLNPDPYPDGFFG